MKKSWLCAIGLHRYAHRDYRRHEEYEGFTGIICTEIKNYEVCRGCGKEIVRSHVRWDRNGFVDVV